ncbi:MAG: diguanylate cyclase [Pseudomonadota bacterium]
MATEPKLARVERTCLDLMFEQTRAAWMSNAFCFLLIWLAFWDNASLFWLTAWTTAGVVMMAIREVQSRRYASLRDQPINISAWTRWLEFSLLLNGSLWGIGCAALTLVATPYQWPVIILIAGGLQTGSVLASSYLMRAFTCFSLPLFLFTLIAFMVLGFGGQPALLVTAALLAVWSLFIFMCAVRFSKHYRRSVGYAFDNLDLAESLESKYQENEELNRSLHHRIEELKSTQRQLLLEKGRSDGLVDQLRVLSLTDGLTGLGNRRSFNENLRSEWQRAMRNDQPMTLIIADVDHFKAYNDRYGHQKGDDCLVQIAGVLAAASKREGEWAARYGGEEFALILANTTLEAGTAAAERIRKNVLACAIEHKASRTGSLVSLSLGVAAIGLDDCLDPESLLACADEALYAAKEQGRNQAVAASGMDKERSESHIVRLNQI